MGSADIDRLIQGRRARKRKASWPAKIATLKRSVVEDRALVWKQAQEKITEARERQEQAEADAQQLRDRLDTMYRHGPSVLEIVQVKQAGFFARLRWALRFAWSKTLRFERIVEGQS